MALTQPAQIWVSETLTALGTGRHVTTPPEVATDGVGAFLDRLEKRLARPDAVVLLDGDLPRRLGFAEKPPRTTAQAVKAKPAQDARARGWTVSSVQPWTTFHREYYDENGKRYSRAVHVGVMPWLGAGNAPLMTPGDPFATLDRMARWFELLGVPYHGKNAGLVALSLMRQRYSGDKTPRWRPNWQDVKPANQATEIPPNWDAPAELPGRYVHPYDVGRQHLSAAGSSVLAVDQLVHRPAGYLELVARNRPGYYLITVPAWAFADRMPHPCGPYPPGVRAWVTAPTVDLLYELAEDDQVIALPEVHESWTADGTRVLRGWAEWIRDALDKAESGEDEQLAAVMKTIYKTGRGMLERPAARVYRPDWSHTIIATARCVLWRKVRAEGLASGRWPQRFETDTVWYVSDDRDGESAASWPATFRRQRPGAIAGAFKWEAHKTQDRSEAA